MDIDFKYVSKHYAARTHEKMQEVLMNPRASGPVIHYHLIRGGKEQKNITVWEPGTVGGEYIKTYGHYHVGRLDETYWIVYGEGVVLLQKLLTDKQGTMIANQVVQFKAMKVEAGDEVYMPAGFGHLVANVGKTYFLTVDNSPVNFDEDNPVSMPGHADYELVKKMRGFAYYVVEQNGKPALKRNPKYQKIEEEDLGGLAVID